MFTDRWRLTLWVKTPNSGLSYRKQRVLYFKDEKTLKRYYEEHYKAAQTKWDTTHKFVSLVIM